MSNRVSVEFLQQQRRVRCCGDGFFGPLVALRLRVCGGMRGGGDTQSFFPSMHPVCRCCCACASRMFSMFNLICWLWLWGNKHRHNSDADGNSWSTRRCNEKRIFVPCCAVPNSALPFPPLSRNINLICRTCPPASHCCGPSLVIIVCRKLGVECRTPATSRWRWRCRRTLTWCCSPRR